MNVSLYQAASALNTNSRWQEVISENLASGSVPGYKRQQLSLAAAKAGLMPANSTGPASFVIPKSTISTSFQPGDLKATGNKNDVAFEGRGFFNVQLPNGTTAYTRDGEFQVSSQGLLTTKEGYPITGESGPIQLDLKNTAPLSISPTGEVSQGADKKGKLKLTDYDKPELLTQISGGYFLANNAGLKTQPVTGSIRQGYLEGSNTSTIGEMANMMTAMRSFEANQRLIQMHDDRMGKAISDLGNPS